MPSGKVHIPVTVAIIIASLSQFAPNILSLENNFIFVCVLISGIFMDFDHIPNWAYIKGYIKGNLEVLSSDQWTNWMHTWKAMAVVASLSVWIGNYLPIATYMVHIVMDGLNRANLKYPNSPLPTKMLKWLLDHRLWCLTFWFSETGESDKDFDYEVLGYTRGTGKNVKLTKV